MVQMRRSTNKKGKQAPAPPKRTRYAIFLPLFVAMTTVYLNDLRIIQRFCVSCVAVCCRHAVLSEIPPTKSKISKLSK